LTGVRLLTLHNLAYMQALVAAARRSIEAGGFAVYRAALLAGAAPWAHEPDPSAPAAAVV
jgi:queuine tRNA-ribosyltransferase